MGEITSRKDFVGFTCNLLALHQKYNCCNLKLHLFSRSDIERLDITKQVSSAKSRALKDKILKLEVKKRDPKSDRQMVEW